MKRLLLRTLGWYSRSELERDLIRFRVASFLSGFLGLLPIPLRRVLLRHRSDKHQVGGHLYGDTYGRIMRPMKYRPIKLLEIGIGGYDTAIGGRSLLAWLEFFPFGAIVACDIQDRTSLRSRRLSVYQSDQSSKDDLQRIAHEHAPFDVIIDDGSHLNRHQIFTFGEMFGALKDGGTYIIEDVQTSYWPGDVSGTNWDGAHPHSSAFPSTCVGHFLEMAKYLNHSEFLSNEGASATMLLAARQIRSITFEHNLVIIQKGRNETPSNILPSHRAAPAPDTPPRSDAGNQ